VGRRELRLEERAELRENEREVRRASKKDRGKDLVKLNQKKGLFIATN